MTKKISLRSLLAVSITLISLLLPFHQALADIAPPHELPIYPVSPHPNSLVQEQLNYLNILIALLATLACELPIAYLFKLRTKKALLSVIAVNVLTIPVFYITDFFTHSAITRGFNLLVTELIIMIVESAILCLLLKDFSKKRVILATFIANIFSLCIGFGVWILTMLYIL